VTYNACKGDNWYVGPSPLNWTAKSRGGCLLTRIDGKIIVPGCGVNGDKTYVKPYTPIGTAYADFQLDPTDDKCTFVIKRRRTAAAATTTTTAYESGLETTGTTTTSTSDDSEAAYEQGLRGRNFRQQKVQAN